jgi:hypothetical protein
MRFSLLKTALDGLSGYFISWMTQRQKQDRNLPKNQPGRGFEPTLMPETLRILPVMPRLLRRQRRNEAFDPFVPGKIKN